MFVVAHGRHGAACQNNSSRIFDYVLEVVCRVEKHVAKNQAPIFFFFGVEEAAFRGGIHQR